MLKNIWDWLTVIFFAAIVYLLVKPGSLAPTLVKNSTEAFASLLKYATSD